MTEPPAPPSYGGPPPPHPGGMPPGEERTWATAAHWSALVGAFVALAFLGPLLVLLVKGNSSWVRRHAVESLNFQLSMLIYGIVGTVLAVVVAIVTLGVGLLVIIPLILVFSAFWLIITIVAAVRTGNGEDYRYPLTIRMVS